MMIIGERRKESRYLDAAHFGGMPLSMVQYETLDPVNVALLGAVTVVMRAKNATDLIEKW